MYVTVLKIDIPVLTDLDSHILKSRKDPVEARLDACTTGFHEVEGWILRSGNILLWRWVTKSFLRPFSP